MNKEKLMKAIQKFRDDLKFVPLSQAGRNALYAKIAVLEQELIGAMLEEAAENKGGN